MLEIEIKAYCDNCEAIIERVISMGGKILRIVNERDIYLNHPSRDFAKTDEALRIRKENNRLILTYKGPKIGKNTKTRFEEEVEFNDFDSMKDILLKLGFVEAGEVVKDREIYLLKGIEICVDRVHGLGDFVELERRGIKRNEIEKDLFELAGKLGLNRFETRSYLELKLDLQ